MAGPSVRKGSPDTAVDDLNNQRVAMAGTDWNKRIQNATDDEALKRVIRDMQKKGISPPESIMPKGYTPRKKV